MSAPDHGTHATPERARIDAVAARVDGLIAAIPSAADELAASGARASGIGGLLRHQIAAPAAVFVRELARGIRSGGTADALVDATLAAMRRFLAATELWQREKRAAAATAPPAKILYLHETSRVAGAERSLLNLARNLDRRRYAPGFILPEPGPLTELLAAESVPVEHRPLPPLRTPLAFARAVVAIAWRLRSGQFALVHGNSPRTNLYAGLAGLIARRPAVFHARNLLTDERFDPDRAIAPLARAVLCNSSAIRARFAGLRHSAVVMNGIDLVEFDPSRLDAGSIRTGLGFPHDRLVIGMTSRFGPDKGHAEFLEAAARLSAVHPDAMFLVVGDAVFPEDRDRETHLRRLAAETLGDRVRFTGFRTDVDRMLAAMDIFVLPAHQEPCGRVLFEAQAMGIPIVATDSGGTPEIVEDGVTGLLVPPRDPAALAAALERLANDPVLRRRMGAAGRARAKALFPIARNARETMRIYDRILRRAAPRDTRA